MTELAFTCIDVRPDRFAAGPTLVFRLRLDETTGVRVHTIALRCQIRIEPQRRNHSDREAEQLVELFGERERWGSTLKPFQFANTSTVVAGFTGSTEVEFAVPCSYDIEVVVGRYFHALEDGEIPFTLLFSGTVFGKGENGLWIEQVPWHLEASHRTPVAVWREMMDTFFPDQGWLRLQRETIDEIARFKLERGVATWDDTIIALLNAAREGQP